MYDLNFMFNSHLLIHLTICVGSEARLPRCNYSHGHCGFVCFFKFVFVFQILNGKKDKIIVKKETSTKSHADACAF